MTQQKPARKKPAKAQKPKVAPSLDSALKGEPVAEVKKPSVEPKSEIPYKEQKPEVIKQPNPPAAKSVLPPAKGVTPVDVPEGDKGWVPEDAGLSQTLYGGGRLKKRLRTRRSRFE